MNLALFRKIEFCKNLKFLIVRIYISLEFISEIFMGEKFKNRNIDPI